MEMKVWLDGYQRVVCGVTEQTTCQDIMIALAHASGKTGRFTMIEKWRTNERCLSPTDFPLLILQKWGEYSSDVQLVLCHSRVGSSRKHRNPPSSGHLRPASNPPEHVPVKKSLTFSGAHRRASSAERPAVSSNGRNVCHSVESSEQGSVASQSSASLSPYMSLERQSQRTDPNLSNGDLEKDFSMRHIWSPDHLRQSSDDRTAFGKSLTSGNAPGSTVPSRSPVPVVSRSQVPVPSVRSLKTTAEVGNELPKPAQRKEALASERKQQNGHNGLETERFQLVSDSRVWSNAPNSLNAIDSSKTSSSSPASVSSFARDTNDNLVTDSRPKVRPLNMPTVKQSNFSRPFEQQNGPSKEKANHWREMSVNEQGIGRERSVAAKRLRPVAENSEGVVPSRTDSTGSNATPSAEAIVTVDPGLKHTTVSTTETSVISKPGLKHTSISAIAPAVQNSLTSKPGVNQAPISAVAPAFGTSLTSKSSVKEEAPISTVAPNFGASLTYKSSVKEAPISAIVPAVETLVTSKPGVNRAPNSSVETQVTSKPAAKQASILSAAPSGEASGTSGPMVAPKSPGLEDPEQQIKEAKERKELMELIGRQEREMLKCESRLKDLNNEISTLEGDLEVDGKQLESQMHRIEEMEAVERQLEEELLELELVSWEDKLVLEKQKENRIRTEILLLQSSIAKSEAEIHSVVEKIRSLTIRTEEATRELNRFLEEKKENEKKEMKNLESSLSEAAKESERSRSVLQSLEEETLAADRSLSRKKEELEGLEGQLKKLNLELFLQEPREVNSTRRSRTPVLERLEGLSRPGSSRLVRRGHLSPSPLPRLNQSIDETDRPPLGYIV